MPSIKLLHSVATKTDARRFLKYWELYLKEKKYHAIFTAIVIVERHLDLDSLDFLIAASKCGYPPCQGAALNAIASKLLHKRRIIGVRALFDAYYHQERPVVRAIALEALGIVASKYKIIEVKPLLISVVEDRQADNDMRIKAYRGLIHLMKKQWTGEQFRLWRITYQQSAAEVIDWHWIAELCADIDKT
jgi:hypothetical protein